MGAELQAVPHKLTWRKALNKNSTAHTPPQDHTETLRSVADAIGEIASEVCGSNHLRLMEVHAQLRRAIRLSERPAPTRSRR